MKDFLKKLKDFGILAAFVLGTIGGIGYAIWGGSWPIAVAVAVLAVLAFPSARAALKDLTS